MSNLWLPWGWRHPRWRELTPAIRVLDSGDAILCFRVRKANKTELPRLGAGGKRDRSAIGNVGESGTGPEGESGTGPLLAMWASRKVA